MALLLQKLPTILLLCGLLGIFISLRKHAKPGSAQLWIVAWALILIHFVSQVFESGPLWRQDFFAGLDLAALQLSGVMFIASTDEALLQNRRHRIVFFLLVGLPVLLHTTMVSLSFDYRSLYVACLALIFLGGPFFWMSIHKRLSLPAGAACAVTGTVGFWTIYQAVHHSYDLGTLAILALVFAIPGIEFRGICQRWTPGVICTTLGFLCWGAVFPMAGLAAYMFPTLNINPELWNVPKFFVAFGMVLALVEEKSASLEKANAREHQASEQGACFAHITSQLLSGADTKQMGRESAEAVAKFSNFRRVAITFCDDDGNLQLVGHGGLTEEAEADLEKSVLNWRATHIAEICSVGRRLGPNSFHVKYAQIAKYNPVKSQLHFESNPHWEDGDEIFVPLRSPRGRYLGAISMDDPRDVNRITASELSKIELLAVDLAVSQENGTLQRQLIQSEKLAAVGKLVSGVAHELNNPLTSIAGYAELLLDDVADDRARQKLGKIILESKRMHVIIDNLLRFARCKTVGQAPLDLQYVLREALTLFSYRIRSENVEIETHVDSGLPKVLGDEDQMKQVFVNLLSNAIEAVREGKNRRLRVELLDRAEKVVVRFVDTGTGFDDVTRAFDPFYTTRPVGKGMGLGLSICYGLVKEHGGEIYAENLEPTGAAVVIELPKQQTPALTSLAAAKS